METGMLEAEAGIETATEKNVLRVLRQVNAPEAGVNIVDLELIYGTDISGRRGSPITMTTPACPIHSYLTEEVRVVLLNELEDLDGAEVQLVWEAPWSAAMISEAGGKRQLGWL